jgi:hypothetical protein
MMNININWIVVWENVSYSFDKIRWILYICEWVQNTILNNNCNNEDDYETIQWVIDTYRIEFTKRTLLPFDVNDVLSPGRWSVKTPQTKDEVIEEVKPISDSDSFYYNNLP